jgi:hypothetical protein
MATSTLTALGLAHAVCHSISSLVQRVSLDAGDEASASMMLKVLQAQVAACNCIAGIASHVSAAASGSVQQQLLASPHLLPCIAIASATWALADHSKRKAEVLTAGGKAGSSSSSSGQFAGMMLDQQQVAVHSPLDARADDIVQHCLRSWQLAEQLVGQLSPCQLKLFELLGMDARVVLCIAQALTKWYSCYCILGIHDAAELVASRHRAWDQQPNLVQLMPATQRQLECKLYLLLPTVLLPYAAGDVSDSAASGHTLKLCLAVLDGWGLLNVTPAWHPRKSWVSPPPPAVWLAEMLPPVLQLKDHWLQSAADAELVCPMTPFVVAHMGEDPDSRPSHPGLTALGHAASALRLLCNLLVLCCAQLSGTAQKAGCNGLGCFCGDIRGCQTPPPAVAAAAAAAADAASLAASLGSPALKQQTLLSAYTSPSGKRLAQLLARLERYVRLLPATPATPELAHNFLAAMLDVSDILTGGLSRPAYAVGPGSDEQQRLHSGLHSLLKLHGSTVQHLKHAFNQIGMLEACLVVVHNILEHQLPQHDTSAAKDQRRLSRADAGRTSNPTAAHGKATDPPPTAG